VLSIAACGGATSASSSAQPSPASPSDSNPPGGGSGSGGAASAACVGVASSPTCDAPIDVASADDVLAQISAQPEITEATATHSSGVALRPTRDLHATATLEIDIAPFRAAHPVCQNAPPVPPQYPGCTETSFSGERPGLYVAGPAGTSAPPMNMPAGVACIATDKTGCTKIKMDAGTTVRFQRASEPYAFMGREPHYVRVLRSCEAPCAGDELRCAASMTCIASAAFCVLCEGNAMDRCACRDGCTPKSDGAECSWDSSDDTTTAGTCTGGACVPR
jgi:hypothetical protein